MTASQFRLITLLTLVLLWACKRDVADLYEPPVPEFPDVGPFLHQAGCVECMQDACATEWTECMGDTACAEQYQCHGRCKEPYCHGDCSALDVSSQDIAERWFSGTEQGTLGPLRRCAAGSCGDECALGRDFQCVGRYTAPDSQDAVEVVAVARDAFGDFDAGIANMTIGVCSDGDPACDMPNDVTDGSSGPVTITLDAVFGRHRQHFLFHVTGQEALPLVDAYPDNHQWSTLPWLGGVVAQLVHSRSVQPFYWALEGLEDQYDPLHPWMYIMARDCHGDMAAGLRLETDADCAPFAHCDFYWSGLMPNGSLQDSQRDGVLSVSAPPQPNQLNEYRLVDDETGRVVSRFTASAAPGTIHTWAAHPLTTSEVTESDR